MAKIARSSETPAAVRGTSRSNPGPSGKLTLRDQQKMLTRAKLLESAEAVFERHGYGGATVGDIVAGAGASHGTFYLYFPTKASVILELMEAGWAAELRRLLVALTELDEPSQANVTAWLKDFIDLYERNAGTLRAWAQASIEEHPLMNQTDDYIRMITEGVTTAIRTFNGKPRGKKSAVHSELLAMTLVFELERVCFFKFVRRWTIQDSILEVLAQRWHAALSPTG